MSSLRTSLRCELKSKLTYRKSLRYEIACCFEYIFPQMHRSDERKYLKASHPKTHPLNPPELTPCPVSTTGNHKYRCYVAHSGSAGLVDCSPRPVHLLALFG